MNDVLGAASWFAFVATAIAAGRAASKAGGTASFVAANVLCLCGLERLWATVALPQQAAFSPLAFGLSFGLCAWLAALRARQQGEVRPRQAAFLSVTSASLAALGMRAMASLPLPWLPPSAKAQIGLMADSSRLAGTASWMAPAEHWLTGVPLLWLATLFGGSVALCAREVLMLWRPCFERTLAARFFVSRDAETVSKVTRVATLGVALGVWLVLTAIGVLSGFEEDLLDKMVGVRAHVTLSQPDGGPFVPNAGLRAALDEGALALAEVVGVTSTLEGPVAVISDVNYASGDLLGIDLANSRAVLPLVVPALGGHGPGTPLPTAGSGSAQAEFMAVYLGSELARSLSVQAGDQVRLLMPGRETLTPLGPVPRVMTAAVAGLITTHMYEADNKLVVVTPGVARTLMQWPAGAITGLAVRVADAARVDAVAAAVRAAAQAAIGPSTTLVSESYRERNKTLFAALALERVVASVVLAFILMVASFSVVNTLTMAIWQRRYEVAILKAMGAANGSVLAIFLWQGAIIGVLGTALGAGLGIATLSLLGRHSFGIPFEVYYLEALPVRLRLSDVATTVMGSLMLLWTFAMLPSQVGARLAPVEALRDG